MFPDSVSEYTKQYPYKYKICTKENGEKYITLRVDPGYYTYASGNATLTDSYSITDITSKHLPLLAYNGTTVTKFNKTFYNNTNIQTVNLEPLEDYDTSSITDMYGLFYLCENITTAHINLDTSNVINFAVFFHTNTQLTSCTFGENFSTKNGQNFSTFFRNCTSLTSIDFSSFDTRNATNMGQLVNNCTNLKNITFGSNFITSNVTDMTYMFSQCTSLRELDLRNFDTSKVKNISFMFDKCTSLRELDLSNFDTSNVSNMEYMFYNCTSLRELDLRTFTAPNCTNFNNVFYNTALTNLIVPSSQDTNITTKLPDKDTAFDRVVDSPETGLVTYTRKGAQSSQTVTHATNVTGEVGTFCETNGGIYDGYENIGETDCICQVVQSTTLNSKIVGIIVDKNKFASHGDCLVKVVAGTYKLGDILVPDISGYARLATETELLYMVMHAIPRPKITSFNTGMEDTVACFII